MENSKLQYVMNCKISPALLTLRLLLFIVLTIQFFQIYSSVGRITQKLGGAK